MAEQTTEPNNEPIEPVEPHTDPEPEPHNEPNKSDKIIEKLQKRIGEEQSKKNEYKYQLDNALKRIEALEKGQEPNPESEPKDDRDDRIAALEQQIKRRDLTDTARQVLAEGGINVPEDVLALAVASDDKKQMLTNVKSLIGYVQTIREEARKEFLKGKTPRVKGGKKTPTNLKDMTLEERSELAREDPELYAKLS
jgi:predicted RNA binding protein with dsRBD fold (UPF0201 family)